MYKVIKKFFFLIQGVSSPSWRTDRPSKHNWNRATRMFFYPPRRDFFGCRLHLPITHLFRKNGVSVVVSLNMHACQARVTTCDEKKFKKRINRIKIKSRLLAWAWRAPALHQKTRLPGQEVARRARGGRWVVFYTPPVQNLLNKDLDDGVERHHSRGNKSSPIYCLSLLITIQINK